MNTNEEIVKGLHFGFIDSSTQALDRYQPALVTNHNGTVLDTLEEELRSAKSFTIAVAFVTLGGLLDLKSTLADIAAHGVKGRLITSTYLSFNHPDVFDDLLHIPNLDVRVLNQDGFHTKAYYFNHDDYESILIGSANLTQNALKRNFEWNLRVTSTERGDIVDNVKNELDSLWNKATNLTTDWISSYRAHWKPADYQKLVTQQPLRVAETKLVRPNQMQRPALDALAELREIQHAKKGLIVAATGTGKTYLAAFDVRQTRPKRVLFVAHRAQILNSAMGSFKKILGGSESDYGILSGESKNLDAKYLFATVNMASSDQICQQLGTDAFDYIIIDEAHRVSQNQAGGKKTMYQKLMDFYQPKFTLGMTATPERTDGTNVYAYFDYHLAYEISLLDSLDHDLLAPFHYIGVTDYEKDGQVIDDKTSLQYLVSDERVDYIISKTDYYGPRRNVHGLIFVSRVNEGQELEGKLNERGIKACFVSAKDSVESREDAVQKLENGALSYIITVDIFNEGVDIPCLNQIVMMRPTQSSIIFLQQLGRGLRKYPDKESVTVLDFIGNYDENYLIPMAFDRSNTSNKEKIRKQIISPSISGVSTIHFEEVARNRVLNAVSKANLNDMGRFRNAYANLKDKIGRQIPMLIDFEKISTLDVDDIVRKFNTVYDMQSKFEKKPIYQLDDTQYAFLDFISRELTVSKRPLEAWILKQLFDGRKLFDQDILTDLKAANVYVDEESLDSASSILDLSYLMSKNKTKFGGLPLVHRNDSQWQFSNEFKSELQSPIFTKYFTDAINTNLLKLHEQHGSYPERFTIGEKYYRSDAIKLLNWKKEQNPQNVGGYIMRPDEKFLPVFITLQKTEKFQNKMAYEDEFLDRSTMRWFSKSGRTTASKTERKVIEHQEFGMIHLFVKKSDDDHREGNDFYYLGSAKVLTAENTVRKNADGKDTKLIDFTLRLEHEVNLSLYRALTEG